MLDAAPIPDHVDAIKDARANLALVSAALAVAVPREVPALSKRRQDLVAFIASGSAAGIPSLSEQLARARAARAARSADTP